MLFLACKTCFWDAHVTLRYLISTSGILCLPWTKFPVMGTCKVQVKHSNKFLLYLLKVFWGLVLGLPPIFVEVEFIYFGERERHSQNTVLIQLDDQRLEANDTCLSSGPIKDFNMSSCFFKNILSGPSYVFQCLHSIKEKPFKKPQKTWRVIGRTSCLSH